MWIQVRTFDGKNSMQVDGLSKLTKVEELRERLVDYFDAPVDHQRLFYRGKQMVDGHSLFDYSVGLNELIQLMVRAPPPQEVPSTSSAPDSCDESSDKENVKPPSPLECDSKMDDDDDLSDSIYKVGDVIDARDIEMGAWFESKIQRVEKSRSTSKCDKEKSQCDSAGPRQVLSETTITDKGSNKKQTNGEQLKVKGDNDLKDENENIDMGDEDASTSDTNCKTADNGIRPYDKLFDIVQDDGFVYHVIYEGYDEEDKVKLMAKDLRPRARTNIKFSDVKVGQVVMTNFNMEDHGERGFWYDCIITGKQDTRTMKKLTATVYFGTDLTPLENCQLLFVDEIFDVAKPGTQITAADLAADPSSSPVKRTNKPDCDHCLDNPRRKCKHCACCVCGGKNDPGRQILCDECNSAYHLDCLSPPLASLPEEDEWYCPGCKNDASEIVRGGEKLKASKKKSKMASSTSTSNRDWGKGMACVGRQKVCNIVPSNHFGPIPGVEVGTMWKFRVQASESGVHRPHVAGIHGREDEGSYSIVLSGGYEDDTDNGDNFLYTGSGGRDLSGNKRTAEQSCDQILTRMNRALAKNCNAPIDAKNGATAKDWRAGKPVRVVRNCKGRKHSDYAPEEGNRYDGIYKMVKYWPMKGKSGFLVWRFLLQRDDPIPAPWTTEGKKRSEQLGLEMQYPEGYLEAQAQKEKDKEAGADTPSGKGKGKRKRIDSDEELEASPKKVKTPKYKIGDGQKKLIKHDEVNAKLWEEAKEHTKEGAQKFLSKVEELFACMCCQDMVYKPVTTPCTHNICKSCLQRSFKAEVHSCPACRTDLNKNYDMPVNLTLQQILLDFFPGYDAGR